MPRKPHSNTTLVQRTALYGTIYDANWDGWLGANLWLIRPEERAVRGVLDHRKLDSDSVRPSAGINQASATGHSKP
jgi:hypothetical protein